MGGSSRVCGNFLFLQGMASFFFAQLGQALTTTGHHVHRINFNGGDRVFWRRPGAIDYRGGLEDWPEFLATCLADWSITDIILFGDCRPLHRVAIQVAARRGIRVHVFEQGYLRPNWITLEQGGVNGHSSMPRDPAWFMETARGLQIPGAEQLTGGSFLRRATEDVLYNVATFLLAWRYPRYRTHRPWHP